MVKICPARKQIRAERRMRQRMPATLMVVQVMAVVVQVQASFSDSNASGILIVRPVRLRLCPGLDDYFRGSKF